MGRQGVNLPALNAVDSSPRAASILTDLALICKGSSRIWDSTAGCVIQPFGQGISTAKRMTRVLVEPRCHAADSRRGENPDAVEGTPMPR